MYAAAWIDAWYIASKLPETVETGPSTKGPVTMVRAHGSDSVDQLHDVARNIALIRIGGLTWRIHDQAALGQHRTQMAGDLRSRTDGVTDPQVPANP